MTTYNTGNPIGSTEVKDLYDNAQNFDTLSTTNTLESVPDRRGVPRMTLHGFEQEARRLFESIKFQPPIPYAPGIEVTTSSLTVDYLGVLYYALPSALPFTTGTWNPAQWSPVQNTNSGNELLVFDDYASASAAAATLPYGQEVEAPNAEGRLSRFDVQSGALVFKDYAPDAIRLQSYTALRAYTGRAESVDISTPGIAGRFNRDTTDTTTADNGGTVIVDGSGRRWKRLYGGPLRVGWFGAVGDGVTDDTAAINSTATAARALKTSIYLDPVAASYKVSASIDFSYINVYGGGRASLIQATAAQFDVVTTSGNSTLKDFAIHGGWDGTTAGQLGDGLVIRNSVSQWAYNVHANGLFIQYCKRNLTTVQYGGYSSLRSIKANACGRHGLEILGASGDATTTTVMVDGTCTYSDCPYGFSYRIENGIDITLLGAIGEYSKGIEIAGNDNRNINLIGVYQENISTGNFLTLTGSGMGLVIHGCFGVELTLPYSANFYDVSIQGNTGFAENGMERNGRSLFVDGGEQTTTTAGTFNAGFVSVPVGTWIISGTVQTIDASPGATINKVGVRASLLQTDSAWVANTNASFVEDIDMRHVSSGADGRASVRFMYSNKTGVPQIMYLRAFVGVTAGTVAFRGAIRAEKV